MLQRLKRLFNFGNPDRHRDYHEVDNGESETDFIVARKEVYEDLANLKREQKQIESESFKEELNQARVEYDALKEKLGYTGYSFLDLTSIFFKLIFVVSLEMMISFVVIPLFVQVQDVLSYLNSSAYSFLMGLFLYLFISIPFGVTLYIITLRKFRPGTGEAWSVYVAVIVGFVPIVWMAAYLAVITAGYAASGRALPPGAGQGFGVLGVVWWFIGIPLMIVAAVIGHSIGKDLKIYPKRFELTVFVLGALAIVFSGISTGFAF